MNKLTHKSAKSTHYDFQAKEYDLVSQESSVINKTIETILNKHKAKSVLDLSCGTGAQVFWLAKRGFDIIGSDISQKMLSVAKSKAKKYKQKIKFINGDMCNIQIGQFDAVISIFNAVGHLTKPDFEKAMRNARDNLYPRGLFIFDIFNLNYLLKGDNITKMTVDRLERTPNSAVRKIQYSTIDEKGVLASFTNLYVSKKKSRPKIKTDYQTSQIYTASQLKFMLKRNGFKVILFCNIDGSRFSDTKSERMMIVAKKV